MDTTITQVEWMDREATTNDNDAIDTDMQARAGDAELIPWPLAPGLGLCTTAFFFVRDTEAECRHVGGLLPYVIRIACSLSSRLMAAPFWSSGNRWCRWCH